ncbi:MAG: hypothetical protein HY568_02795 [Candidatus Latescibacteria bacterium]|nr:hypothetical protein [Candidatus Latescibacterota bacterium]
MEERIASIERTAGFGFVLGSILLALAVVLHPVFPEVNRTNLVLQAIAKSRGESWMQLHAFMAVGFVIATIAFSAFAFLLHLKGSSGTASIVATCALLGGGIWVTFLCAELYAYRFFVNLYGVDPGGSTMHFSTVWFWKLGALVFAGALFFVAVAFAGVTAAKREVLPVWLGWGGAFFAIIGLLVYVMEFWGTTATGAATQPMQWPAVRYGIGLPLQLWMLGVGVIFLRRYFSRPVRMRMTHARPAGEPAGRRGHESPVRPAAEVPPSHGAGVHPAAPASAPRPAGTEAPPRPAQSRIPHPARAPEPEDVPPTPPSPEPGAGPPKRQPPPQIFPG